MYEQYKFVKLKDILLYTISRNKKSIKLRKILSLHSEIKPITINSALMKLNSEKLIKVKPNLKDLDSTISINLKKIDKIKEKIGEHWEHGWEVDWKYATKG